MTTADFLIKGASLPDGKKADISISNGVIASVGSGFKGEAHTVIDGKDCVVLPGLVDLHTHLREPGREDAETVLSGSSAGVKGGFTAVSAMANTSPVADTAGVVEQVYRLGQEAGLLDVFPIGAVTEGLKGESLSEIGAMADSVARVRVFSDDGNCVSDPLVMRRALEYIKKFGGVIAQHAQDPRMTIGSQMNEGEISARLGLKGWPAVAEEAIIARDVLLADHVKSRLHICHLTTAGGVEIIRWAKARGIDVTAEVTPHHLLLTDDLASSYDPVYKVNPPLRTESDVHALREALADGTIDIVAGRSRWISKGNSGRTIPPSRVNTRGFSEVNKDPRILAASGSVTNPNEGDPDFLEDASRIYVSMSTEIDRKFMVFEGQDQKPTVPGEFQARLDDRERAFVCPTSPDFVFPCKDVSLHLVSQYCFEKMGY